MSEDSNRDLPEEVIQKMIDFATPHNTESIFYFGSGALVSQNIQRRFPDSPVVESNGFYKEHKHLFHAFDRVISFLPSVDRNHLMGLSLMAVDDAPVVIAFPVRRSWFGRISPMRADACSILENNSILNNNSILENKIPSLTVGKVGIVDLGDRVYAISRCTNYYRSSNNSKSLTDLVRAVSFIQQAGRDQDFFYFLADARKDHPSLNSAFIAMAPVVSLDFQDIVSYLTSPKTDLTGSKGDLLSIIVMGLEKVHVLERSRNDWMMDSGGIEPSKKNPYDQASASQMGGGWVDRDLP